MPLAETETIPWSYPLTRISQNKEVARPGTPKQFAHELVGVDGRIQGGVRPSSGFKMLYEFDYIDAVRHSASPPPTGTR